MKKIKSNEKGFSLVELLVVVIIIAIVAAIAIPSLLASRRAANEASAISSMRTIHSAQATYFGTTGLNANYTDLAGLLGDQLIDATLAGGTKSGFTITAATGAAGIYCATAVPTTAGITGTGNRSFAVSQPGVVFGIVGGVAPACAALTGIISTGAPIQ